MISQQCLNNFLKYTIGNRHNNIKKIMSWYLKITIELPLLLIYSGFLLFGSIMTNLIIFKTCYVTLGYNESQCALLGRVINNETIALEKLVQPTANILTMIFEMPLAIIPVIICIFAGPWSDKHGRKPVQLMALMGLTVTFFMLTILVCFKNLSPWFFLVAAVPTMLTGSVPTYLTSVLSYLNDISTDDTRAVRMAIFESITVGGILIGTMTSAPLLYATNYETVFALASILLGVATLYTMCVLPESVELIDEHKSKLSEAVRCSYIAEMIKVIFKKRESYDRIIIFVIFLTFCLTNFITNGQNVVKFQFLRENLGWTLTKHNYYICFSHIVTILGTISGTIILNRFLKIRESVISLISLVSSIGSCILFGLATNDYYIFIGTIVGILSGATIPLLRTRVAQILPANEMGKIFSLIIGAGGLFSLGATYLYTMIYNATLGVHSGTFYFLSAIFYAFAIFLVGAIIIFEYCTPKDRFKLVVPEMSSYKETRKI